MVLIRFPSERAKDRALELLLGEFPIRSWKTGELLLPEEGLSVLTRENVPFIFDGVEANERVSALRDTAATPV